MNVLVAFALSFALPAESTDAVSPGDDVVSPGDPDATTTPADGYTTLDSFSDDGEEPTRPNVPSQPGPSGDRGLGSGSGGPSGPLVYRDSDGGCSAAPARGAPVSWAFVLLSALGFLKAASLVVRPAR